MQRDFPAGFAVGIGLTLILPLLNYLREPPLGDFYGEWLGAVAFAASLLFLLPSLKRTSPVSLSLFIAPAVLALVLVIQTASRRIDYAYDWITWIAYLALLVLAFLVGQAVAGEGGRRQLTDRLAFALILAGVVNFGVQLIQLARLAEGLAPFVVPLMDDACRVFGNVGQANHATSLAWLTALAALYLQGTGRIRSWVAVPLVLCMLFSSALTASRMAWIYLPLAAFVILTLPGWPATSLRSRLVTATVLISGFVLATFATSVLFQMMDFSCATSVERLVRPSAMGYAKRLELWRQAVEVWSSSPLLGAGAGLYMASVYHLQALGLHQPLDYYAHNVGLQILAEFGVVAALAIAATILWWAVLIARHRKCLTASDAVLLVWLGVLGVHSLLEFPLYYVHFLVLFGLCVGLVVRAEWTRLSTMLPLRSIIGTLSVVVAIGCVVALVEYRRVDRLSYLVTIQLQNNFGSSPETDELLNDIRRGIFVYAPLADVALGLLTPLNEKDLTEKIEATERLIKKSPTSFVIMRRIALALLAKDEATAVWHAERLAMFYPHSAPDLFRDLERRFADRPELADRLSRVVGAVMANAPTPRW